MPIFDFHCHPAFKHLLGPAGSTLTPWDDIKVKLHVGKLFGREITLGINQLFNGAFNSQSNLRQMQQAGVNLAGVALYSIENKIAQGIMQRKIASEGNIGLLDPDKLQEMQKGNDYYGWTKKTMDSLIKNTLPPPGIGTPDGTNFKFINSVNEYDEQDAKTVHGLLILEGLHNFCSDPFNVNAEDDFNNNFADFQTRYNTRILAVNIPHLQDFPCANHAFGMQFINEEMFFPNRSGLSDWGKRAVKKLYDNNILVDFKHMSYFTRTQLVAERGLIGHDDKPLICTHAGLTGCHSDFRYQFLSTRAKRGEGVWRIRHCKPIGVVQDSSFNRSSINLYDDEIVMILQTNGLIGISLDQRILGFPTDSVAYQINDSPYDQEYIADGEDEIFFRGIDDPEDIEPHLSQDDILTGDEALVHGENSVEFHYYYFLNHIFHILQVAQKNGLSLKQASSCICIGSDFDGLINPLDCCISAEMYTDFKNHLLQILKGSNTFWKTLSIKKSDIDADELLDGIFFSNAFNFLKTNFV
ncbi:MAG: hypothetical protein ABI707_05520 [Ferruginibacter sp.]